MKLYKRNNKPSYLLFWWTPVISTHITGVIEINHYIYILLLNKTCKYVHKWYMILYKYYLLLIQFCKKKKHVNRDDFQLLWFDNKIEKKAFILICVLLLLFSANRFKCILCYTLYLVCNDMWCLWKRLKIKSHYNV